MSKNDIDPIDLFFGGMISLPIINGILKYFQKNQSLSQYQEQWKKLTKTIESRRKKLIEYNLIDTINSLNGRSKDAFNETMGCYLYDLDLAASNMICLSIEIYLRESTNNYDDRLYDLIERLVESHKLDPEYLTYIHAIRKKRNIQVHTADKFEEISILGMFKMMRDLVNIFSPKLPILDKNE